MKSKNLAALLSLLFPGLGHLYVGKYLDAIVFLIGAGVVWAVLFFKGYYLYLHLPPRFYLVVSGLSLIYLYSLVDAYRKTK